MSKENNLLFILLWMAALLIFAYSWVPGGLDVDSCNYAVVAKEALRSHTWLKLYDPVYQGVFYYHFPLCIWITALLFKFFGVATFTAKLFSMVSAFTLVALIFYLGRLLKNHWVGFFGGISFLLTNHIVRLSRQCRMDLPVSLFIALAIAAFILAQRRSRLYYLFFGLFTSLAILSKDIFGLAPLAIVFVYFILIRRLKELFHPLFILGLLFAIGPVLFWIWLDQKTLFNPWLNWNFLHLLKSPAFKVPWYYYTQAIVNKYFYFLPLAIYGGYLAVKEGRNNKNYEFYLLIIWAIIFPLAFSFGSQKLHYFILPMYPAASLLVGIACERLFKEGLKLKIATGIKYILIIAGIAILSLPFNIRSKRFIETVNLAPIIDEVLKKTDEYEFIVYNQDVSAILFYSQELSRVKHAKDKASLEDVLARPYAKARLCYMKEPDFLSLNPTISERYRIILRYKDTIIAAGPAELSLPIVLP